MTRNVNKLMTAVTGFMHRMRADFQWTDAQTANIPWDVMLQAVNNTRLFAERMVDFEYAKVSVQIPNIGLLSGGSLANAVTTDGTNTPVQIKKIITPFLPLCNITDQFPVDLVTKKSWNDRLKRRFEGARPKDRSDFAYITESPYEVVQNGMTVFIAPADANAFPSGTVTIFADVVAWLPEYIIGTESDFLLDFCFDWMMYHTVQELNFFLKEDERVQLSAAIVNASWDAVVKWNNELINATAEDVTNLE